jgi:hypothetical protein
LNLDPVIGGGVIAVWRPGFSGPCAALVSLTALWWLLEGALMLAAPQRVLERPDAGKHLRRMTSSPSRSPSP